MNIWEADKLLLFLSLIFPGFISIQTYSLIRATGRRDYSKSIVEIVCYSVLNFALLSWIIIPIYGHDSFSQNHPFLFYLGVLAIFLIGPALWPLLLLWLSEKAFVKKFFLSLHKKPWDFIFSKKDSMWVVVHLTDKSTVLGKYGTDSFASAHPEERQIYLEEIWHGDITSKPPNFINKYPRTKGAVFPQEAILYLEFYK